MNLMGYDAVTPGDHDFDFGVESFQRSRAAAAFPWVSANLFVLPADTLLFAPYVVVNRNGVRVAIAGFTTPAAMVSNGDKLKGRMRVGRIEPQVGAVLKEMRQDADLTVVLSHSGLDGAASYDTTGVGGEQVTARMAAGSLKPDIVVVGHSHREVTDTVIAGVHFVQPRPEGRSVAVIHIALVPKAGALQLARVRAERIQLEDVRRRTGCSAGSSIHIGRCSLDRVPRRRASGACLAAARSGRQMMPSSMTSGAPPGGSLGRAGTGYPRRHGRRGYQR
jgi:2',3'-cyclic-nucleotide 2'-phosphodiesterase/3'-nucleotidase